MIRKIFFTVLLFTCMISINVYADSTHLSNGDKVRVVNSIYPAGNAYYVKLNGFICLLFHDAEFTNLAGTTLSKNVHLVEKKSCTTDKDTIQSAIQLLQKCKNQEAVSPIIDELKSIQDDLPVDCHKKKQHLKRGVQIRVLEGQYKREVPYYIRPNGSTIFLFSDKECLDRVGVINIKTLYEIIEDKKA